MSAEELRETVALKEYLEARLADQALIFDERFKSAAIALQVARHDMDKHLAHLNNLREEVLSDRSLFVPILQYQERHEALRRDLEALKIESAKAESRSRTWATAVGLAIAALSVALHFLK